MIKNFNGNSPKIHENTFIADSADIIGKVTIEENASVWFGAVLRGDCNSIYIGKCSNVQDNCSFHAEIKPVELGEGITVGHGAILHGCKVKNYSLIGMGSIILDGAEIDEQTIIGAGSLVTSNKKIPSGVLCMGSPAKVVRQLTEEEKQSLKETAESYVEESRLYRVSR